MQADIEKLWDIAYKSFEARPFDAVRTIFAMKGTANQVQFRLMKSISQLKTEPQNDDLLDAIRGDLLLAQTTGIMPASEATKALDLLDKLSNNRKK